MVLIDLFLNSFAISIIFHNVKKNPVSASDSIKETITSEYQKIVKLSIDQNAMSYADATKTKTNADHICNTVKLAVKKANKEEKIEEVDKKKRIRNIVVHGVQEKVANKEVDTKTWTDKFITALHTYIKIKKMSRIGSAKEGRIRPILIELESEKDKFKLLNNLKLLKGSKEYMNISVTEDLTLQQRETYKELLKEAKKRNLKEDSNFSWRVRGSTNYGFFIKQIKTRPVLKTPNE